ncbi:MAG: hypothetical protein KKB30_02425 [Proteobacteria bacterium]|nr:hypothetical protein [Pseudomonadota bacterium]MBU1715771.1 hypothetical protein [Pseudomonadota bacterium]
MKTNKTNLILSTIMALGITCLTANTVLAETEKPEADMTVGFYSQYIWRGYAFSKESLVVQPSMSVSYKGLGLNMWGNLDTNLYTPDPNDNDANNFNETDLTLSYDGSFGKIGYGVGYIYYGLDAVDDSQEIYVSVSVDTILSPSLTIYNEIAGYQGWYANLSVSHSVPLTEKISLDLGASVGYLDNEDDYSELHDGMISAAVAIPLAENITITPELHYSFALSGAASDALEAANLGVIDEEDANFIYGGLSVNMAF